MVRMSDLRRSQRSAGSMDCENGNYPNPKRALSEFHKVLKPNGQVVLADPTAPLPVRCGLNSVVRLLRMGDMRIYDKRDLTNLFDSCGFQSIDWRTEGSWGFVASARCLGSGRVSRIYCNGRESKL